MKESYILLDVGGTQIKGGISDAKGRIEGELLRVPSCAKGTKEEIFSNFSSLIQKLLDRAGDKRIEGIGMAFPGPFDYEHGVSLMKGLDKYDSIYQMPIEAEMKRRCREVKDVRFVFLHDVEAFAIGVSRFGKAWADRRILCLCIGTGAGSAFIENKIPLKEETQSVPQNGWLYNTPYKDSIIDDYLSVRGLYKISSELLNKSLNGKELFELCENNDAGAIAVFRRFGEDVSQSIVPFLDSFKPGAIVIGGQISKSFSYFGQELKKECVKRNIRIHLEPETSMRAMQGLYAAFEPACRDNWI